MTDPIFSMPAPSILGGRGSYAVLDQFGLIDAVGPDARTFLHNQLTNDVTHLEDGNARLAGFCSPKGRLLASFLYWTLPNQNHGGTAEGVGASTTGIRLMIAADIREAIQKRLKMFVMRSKVTLSSATAAIDGATQAGANAGTGTGNEVVLIGIAARADKAAPLNEFLEAQFGPIPGAVREVTRRVHGDGNGVDGHANVDFTLIRLPDAALCMRYLLVLPGESWAAIKALFDEKLESASPELWDWLDVHSGEPRITAATQDKFVPQMINFEAIGGVNFRKGCYPGQEVVARSQYRGTIKRRAKVAHSAEARPGDEVFDEADPLQPCGHIVNTASAPDGGVDCLAELKLSLSADAALHVGAPDGPKLTVLGLPYALPDLNA